VARASPPVTRVLTSIGEADEARAKAMESRCSDLPSKAKLRTADCTDLTKRRFRTSAKRPTSRVQNRSITDPQTSRFPAA
jgi:hypothetical protein